MQIKNVYYAERPDDVIITANKNKAVIEFPVNVTEIETEEGTQYKAATVYVLETANTTGLRQRVEDNYDAWLEKAKEPVPQTTTLEDVVDGLNALQEYIFGGGI